MTILNVIWKISGQESGFWKTHPSKFYECLFQSGRDQDRFQENSSKKRDLKDLNMDEFSRNWSGT